MAPESPSSLKAALIAAARDPALRARAVSALRGVELWAASWPTDPNTLRTLTSSDGVTALPLFSDEEALRAAALRYAWAAIDGDLPRCKLALWEAMRLAKLQRARLLVVDIGAEHALELDEGDIELLSSAPSSKPPSGSVKVRSTPPAQSEHAVRRASSRPTPTEDEAAAYSPLRPRIITPHPGAHAVSATFGATPTATMAALPESPEDALLDALSDVLRDYPEVEWACLVLGARADSGQAPSVALRVDPAFPKNLTEITRKLHEVAAARGERNDVLVLETPEQMKQARQVGLPFYPWRKK